MKKIATFLGVLLLTITALYNTSLSNRFTSFNGINLTSLFAVASARGEVCLSSHHFEHNRTRSSSGAESCVNEDGSTCGNQELCEYTSSYSTSCTEHVCTN